MAACGPHSTAFGLDPVGTPLVLALKARAQVFTGDAEGGLATALTCETRAPQFQPCLVFLAVAAAAAGDETRAKDAGQRLLTLNPHFTIESQFRLVPYRRPEDVGLLTKHLLTAGLPA